LEELDFRDVEFWVTEAKRFRAERATEGAECARMAACADGPMFGEYYQSLYFKALPDGVKEESVRDNWEYLKRKKRG